MGAGGGHSAAVVTAPEESREVWVGIWGWSCPGSWRRSTRPYAALDTEFPGFLHQTRGSTSPCERYQESGAMWTILSSSSWDKLPRLRRCLSSDARSEASVELLKRSGIDLSRARREGVDWEVLSELLRRCDWVGRCKPRWVTFQGLYEVAYLVKLLTVARRCHQRSPGSPSWWATLGRVIAVKYLTRFCGGFHLGLARLAETVGVKLEGGAAHQAGVDALLTASVFEVQTERICGGAKKSWRASSTASSRKGYYLSPRRKLSRRRSSSLNPSIVIDAQI
ncbi:unnamed protein product [Spirodela intermedia]|uniref:Uncharacterized protein n=1 Tax=Spirodela intermedia TaxID=51605 RepID=A0A7I8J2S8_SPIIN|nr:unnamed protein product [Spirodela intermedia]CAA6664427.1 unnamed protein product [Spirodela intermedia]